MKIAELIEQLKTLPADAQVLVQGYEDGFDDVKAVREIAVVKNSGAKDWDGEYEETETGDKAAFQAVVIFGNRR